MEYNLVHGFKVQHKNVEQHDTCPFTFLNYLKFDKIYGEIAYKGTNIYVKGKETPFMKMSAYPFNDIMANKHRFIPYGYDPVLTVIAYIDDKIIFRLQSSRRYNRDSLIYFDTFLVPLYHRYFHKHPPSIENLNKIEERIVKTYPVPTKAYHQYRNWNFV